MSATTTQNGNSPSRRSSGGRSPQELDYRHRGLIFDPSPGGYVPTAPTQPDRQHRRSRPLGPIVAKLVAFLLAASLVFWLIQAFVAQPFLVPGGAMAPTLQSGDRVLVVKAGFLQSPVRSGQIVVIRPPRFLPCTVKGTGSAGDLVLRVVALPGQAIWSIGDTIFVAGRPLHETGWYSPHSGPLGSRPIASTTLGQNQYFVLGDNRASACDSRAFGPIARSAIVGEAIATVVRDHHVYWHSLPA